MHAGTVWQCYIDTPGALLRYYRELAVVLWSGKTCKRLRFVSGARGAQGLLMNEYSSKDTRLSNMK